jgi:hypothetical protein
MRLTISSFLLVSLILSSATTLMLSSSAASAQISSDLEMVLLDQNPYPAEPGVNVDIEVNLENQGLGEATNLAVEIVPKGPFSLVKGEKVKTFQRIGGKSSVKLAYTLLVDDSALAGDYDLEFRIYNPITPSAFQTREIELTVIGDTKLIVDKVETTPSTLEPGGMATIHVTVKNVGTGDARQLEVKMNSSSPQLVPVLSGGLVYVGDLKAGDNKTIDLMFNIDPEADQNTYLAEMTLRYKDEDNQDSSATFDIGIPVEGTVLFEIVSTEPSFTRGTLDIEVANKGTGDASSVEARLIVNGETVGVDYLSQLKATKKTTFSFPLVMSGNAELLISYVEPGLDEESVTKNLGPLNFAAPGGDGSSILAFILILAVIGYFVWRRFFRKKKRHD